MDILFIDNSETLALACDQFRLSPFLCVDTEFHRETTYYPELALIQISNGQQTICVDPLALHNLKPLLALLGNPEIMKVFHASQQDIEIFHHQFGILPAPLFDTQIAAGLLGYGEQIGYAPLMKNLLNVDIDKSLTRTDWMKRPLNNKQIQYAASDVYYLAKAYPVIEKRLKELNRLDWLKGDFSKLCTPANYKTDTHNIWKKTKGNQSLRGQQLAVLQAVAACREEMAQQKNRPRRRVLPDDALIDIAKQKPDTVEKILALRTLKNSRLSKSDAEQFLLRIQQGLRLAKDHWPHHPVKTKLTLPEDALVDSLMGLLKLMAHKHHISPAILATRKELEALMRGEDKLPLLTGWRYAHAGQELVKYLDGHLCLSAQSDKLISEEK
ncbi:MAG: ribonuclease D [Gammaproteobacteria bacterium]|nr:ribonuclease D [Gammaproteobacteria bacterium]